MKLTAYWTIYYLNQFQGLMESAKNLNVLCVCPQQMEIISFKLLVISDIKTINVFKYLLVTRVPYLAAALPFF